MQERTVELGGKAWPVKMFSLKDNRTVVPAILRLQPTMEAMKNGQTTISSDAMDDLYIIAFQLLRRGTPELTFAEFEELPGSLFDLIQILPVAAELTGMLKYSSSPVGEPVAGVV